jgi:hypothetical protein
MMNEEFPELRAFTDDEKHKYYKEKLTYFYYFFTRTTHMNEIKTGFDDFINVLKSDIIKNEPEYKIYLSWIYKLTLHTRDQFNGKGEHDISYMIIDVLYAHFPELAMKCLRQFVIPTIDGYSLGSWRDIKYLCEYTKNQDLIEECIELINNTFMDDITKVVELIKTENITSKEIRTKVTNVAKWIPREHKKFDWLFERLVLNWTYKHCPQILKYCKTTDSYQAALRKCKKKYRILVSTMNILLDTTEVKLCSQNWNIIKIENIPQIAFEKYKSSLCKYIFEPADKIFENDFYSETNMKRLECSLKIKDFLNNKYYPMGAYEPNRIRSKYVPFSIPLCNIIKEAFSLLDKGTEIQIDILNNQWLQITNILGGEILGNIIPVIDMSFYSKQTDSYYTAIGLALLVAERSIFENRIMVIDNQLSWVNLQEDIKLFDKIKKLCDETKSRISTISNRTEILEEFINYIDESKMKKHEVGYMSMVFFQTTEWNEELHKITTDVFYDKGYPSPKMVYWNLYQMNKNPVLPGPINKANCVFLSGHNPRLILDLTLGSIFDIIDNKYEEEKT